MDLQYNNSKRHLDIMCNCSHSAIVEIPKKCPPKIKLTNLHHDLQLAKSILQRSSNNSGDNVFDHLSDLIKKIIDDDPPNVADYFDEYSRVVREEKFRMSENNFMETFSVPAKLSYACNVMDFLKISLYPEITSFGEEEEHKSDIEEPFYTPTTKDVMHMQFYWNLCGFGLEQESYLLSCSIEKFEKHSVIQSCRFWGKMFGRKKNYYILEVDLKPEEIASRLQQMKLDMMEKARTIQEEDYLASQPHEPHHNLFPGWNWKHNANGQLSKMDIKQPPMPRNFYQKSDDIPPEWVGKGLNRKSYFVCNDPVEEWIELPIVTPKQIVVSRTMKCFLTGDLEAHIVSYPPFPGKEKHYLRALIARISAGTLISPAGFMKIGKKNNLNFENEGDDEEEEEAEEEEEEDEKETDNDKPIVENVEYKPLQPRMLLDLRNWQHIRPAILAQGRILSYDEKKYRKEFDIKDDGVENEEGQSEAENEESEEEETSTRDRELPLEMKVPPLFTKISDDEVNLNIPSWTIRKSTQHSTKNQIVMVKSNVWPGACAFAMENMIDNVYIGWGGKYVTRNLSPPPLTDIQEEYPIGPEILEILDPSAKQEQEWRLKSSQ